MPLILDGTKGETFPSWTTATRPATPNAGQTGYNTTLGGLETYNGSAWVSAVVNSDGQIVASAGTAALPGITTTGDTNTGIFFPAADTIGWTTGGSERARIDSSGNLLVDDTSSSATSGSGIKLLPADGGANTPRVAIVTAGSTSGSYSLSTYSTGAGAYRFFVNDAGTINATSNTITSISDRRLKENIVDLDVGLDALLALKPRKFDWKTGKGKDIKGDRGWVADEFQQIFPDLVEDWLDAPPEGEEPYKAVRPDLIPVLVKAIQELSAKLDAAEARIAALEAK